MSETSTSAPSASSGVQSNSTEASDKTAQGGEPQSQQTPQSLKEKFKFAVDGEEFEEEVDFSNKEDLKRRFQMAHAAKKRMAEAAAERKKAYQIVQEFEANPESMLSRLGPKGREIAEKFLLNQIKEEMLSPEEREMRDLKKYKESTEAEKAKIREAEVKAANEKKEMEVANQYQEKFIQALEKSGLPKSPDMIKRMAKMEAKNLEYGLDLSPEELAGEVKKELISLVKFVAGDADGDQLINMLGEDISKKIRKSDLKKLQEIQSKVFQPGAPKAIQSATQESRPPMTIDEWKENLNKRFQK